MEDFQSRMCGGARLVAVVGILFLFASCGYRFYGAPEDNPFPAELKTILVDSAENHTTVTGIETELTNDLRREFAVGTGLRLVNAKGDVVLKTSISSYVDTPSSYKADGKELTRVGTLMVNCRAERTDSQRTMWQKTLAASQTYTVTDTIAETLSNRRKAISHMIKDIVPRIHRSLYENF